jgi:energy-coupling factor transport system substrate-specific component
MVVLMLALGGGMIWYERSRPPSQIVALVAVLAALAVAGRIVLAPIPNVVATTDIVFFAGFALGPAPGFAVGALGGLVSNFWLGQGVWTPWQMVGWGMTGVAGGLLCYLTRGRANRFTLAIACGAAGLVFGAWMNFQAMVAFGGEMSLDRYLALEVRAIPFDLAHITGNVIFALAIGPAMIAALRRFRERFEWHQVTSTVGGLLVAVALVTVVAAPSAKAATSDETELAAGWLRAQQNDDGGFASSPGGTSTVGMTARAMLGLAAANINPRDVVTNQNNPLNYLVKKRKKLNDAGDLALAILACKTVGKNPRKFHGRDLVTALHVRRGKNNSYGNKVNTAAYAALAFKSAEAEGAKERVIDWLISVQNMGSGGWGISDAAKSDPDSTGTALQAIHGKKNIRPAMTFLKKSQKSSGGWASGGTVNSQSTGLALQGAMGAGKGRDYMTRNGNSGLDYLLARQADDGSIWYSKQSDQTRVWVTSDTLIAIAGETLPIGQPKREPKPKSNSNTSSSSTSGGSSSSTGSTTTPNLYDSSSSGSSSNGSGGNGSGGGSGNGSNKSGGSSGGNGSDAGDASDSTDSGTLPLDTEVPVIPVAPSAALLAASQQGPQPSPVIATLICLIVAGGLAGGTVLLARRFKW